MPFFGFTNSAAETLCQKMDKWGFNYLTEQKTMWEKKKLLVTSNFEIALLFPQCFQTLSVVDVLKHVSME